MNRTNQTTNQWNVYRTRFLVRAKQLAQPLTFTDVLGREHRGEPGDYLIETSDGTTRIASRAIFEDIYVVMSPEGQGQNPIGIPVTATRRKLTGKYPTSRSSTPSVENQIHSTHQAS